MSRIQWDLDGQRLYETGVKNGVLYPKATDGTYPKGVAWNGLTGVTESPSGAEPTAIYADDMKYLNLMSAEEFGATIEAYTYPKEFEACNGEAEIATGVTIGQQTRKPFGFCYRTAIGNDIDGYDYGYKLHLVYGAKASPSEKSFQTVNETPEAITFSWEIDTVPVPVEGFKATAHLEVDTTKVAADKVSAIEDILYGTATTEPRLPLPAEVISIIAGGDTYTVVNPTYTQVSDPSGSPATQGYYETDGSGYKKSTDTEVDSDKTYYSNSQNPSALSWYESIGSSYALSTDTTVDPTKTYYEKVSG